MKKRMISFMLVILMALALMPTVTAAQATQDENDTPSCDDWGQVESWRGDVWICPADPDEFLILVNGDNYLGIDHSPDDLLLISGRHELRARAARAFSRMQDSMNAEGLFLTVRSGYRPYVDQRYLFNRAVATWGLETALRWWARPGHSEHQTGLAVDILQHGYTGTILNNARFQETQHYAWLMENAHNYGFIMRYPLEYESITGIAFEPWHWRYIGIESATYMKKNGFTVFEVYIEHREARKIED
jgi:D-alanyl-D-alanine carboxypeptidase